MNNYYLQRSIYLEIFVKVRQASRRKDLIALKPYIINDETKTLKDLIEQIVTINVNNFNQEKTEENLSIILSEKELIDSAHIGKISFGNKLNTEKQDLSKAIDNALQSFEDGIYRVLINTQEVSNLTDTIDINNDSEVVFIKLVMLAGRLW